MTKDDLRKQALLKRDSLLKDKITGYSREIFDKLTALLPYKEAGNILIYASMRSEVITDEIILDALASGKRVFCPKVVDKTNGLMTFVRIRALEELKEGYFGIREPVVPSGYAEPDFDIDKSLLVTGLFNERTEYLVEISQTDFILADHIAHQNIPICGAQGQTVEIPLKI